MTDREKAFVMNGVRNHLRGQFQSVGANPDHADRMLLAVAKRLMIEPAILELTRHEHQEFLEQIMTTGEAVDCDGD